MAIGVISSPATWLNGTVLAPSWAQNVQDNVNLFYGAVGNGTLSAYSLTVDGTGNQSITGVAGTVKVSAGCFGTATPTATASRYSLYKESIPLAWLVAGSTGLLTGGFNILSVVKNSTGNYTVNLNSAAVANTSNVVVASVTGGTAGIATGGFSAIGTTSFNVFTFNTSGTATDFGFSAICFAQ